MGSSHSKAHLTTSKIVKAALPLLKGKSSTMPTSCQLLFLLINELLTSYNSEDPYAYANGHWLHRDKEQRQARQLDFNFSGLSQIALDAIKDATRIISYEKEGGYNRVFNFKLDNGDQVVTKIPTLVAGAPWLTVNSEVATV